MKLRWGILSGASIAIHTMIPAIQQAERGEAVAIASRSIERAVEAAERLGIEKAYGSYEELLADPDIDAVYIPLPNHLHKEWAIKAAEAGKHVLCEKPFAITAADAGDMAKAAQTAGIVMAEAFMYRHHPRFEQIKAIIASGEIGELRVITGSFTFNNAADAGNVRYNAEWGGGSLYDIGCYLISAARLILGGEPVAASVHGLFSKEHGGVDMMASGILEFANDVSLVFDCGMWAAYRNRMEILGTKGRIELPNAFGPGEEDYFIVHTEDGQRKEGPFNLNTYVMQINRIAQIAAGEEQPLFGPEDAIAGTAVIEACLTSAREQRRVLL